MYQVYFNSFGNKYALYKTGDGGFDLVALFFDKDDAEFACDMFESCWVPNE